MKLIFTAALLISSLTYQQELSVSQKPGLDHEFKIKIGQQVLIDKLSIKFDAVAQDNRCACDEECGSRHSAVMIFRLAGLQSVSKCIVLNAYSEPEETHSRGYRIRLLRLDPCLRTRGTYIDNSKYEATLLISRGEAESGANQNNNANQQGESPNFSGTWRRMQSLDAGSTLVISHHGPELRVTSTSSAMAMTSRTENTYYIDGKKHVTDEISDRSGRAGRQNQRTSTRIESLVKWEGNRVVIVDKEGTQEWELSESGRHLILTTGKTKNVYQKVETR